MSSTEHFARQQNAGVSAVKRDSDSPSPNPVGTAKLGKVSRRDRDVLRKYAQALAVPHLQSPPGNLREALISSPTWPTWTPYTGRCPRHQVNGADAMTLAPETRGFPRSGASSPSWARRSARWAVFGAVAANVYRSAPRTTLDVDFLASISAQDMRLAAQDAESEGWAMFRVGLGRQAVARLVTELS